MSSLTVFVSIIFIAYAFDNQVPPDFEFIESANQAAQDYLSVCRSVCLILVRSWVRTVWLS